MPEAIKDSFALALAQGNPVLGDIPGNLAKIREFRARAAEQGADLIVFSELFLTGYPLEDLVLKPALQEAARIACEALAKETEDDGPAVLIGLPWEEKGLVYNAMALLDDGKVETVRFKCNLPNYGVFDEKRVFAEGPLPGPINFRGLRLGVPICEDIWSEDVCETLAETGAELFIVPNGSPYWADKHDQRIQVAAARIAENGLPLAYLNQVGGQDELVFDGASFVLNADSSLAVQMPDWEEACTVTRWKRDGEGWVCEQGERALLAEGETAKYLACVTGLRDYVGKNGFPGVVLGLSGGIDSAISAAMAVDALGADKVHCVMLPYTYTSSESLEDAKACADALGIRYDILPIHDAVDGLTKTLEPLFKDTEPDITEENLQSRARGTLLMAISNKFGPMVVTTGNKSEVSVGYATLYGDMNGGFNPIKDLYKTEVFALARYRNRERPKGCLGPEGEVIPERIITKPPTAELKADQRDQDTLPDYEVLDDILECLVEQEMPLKEIVARGHEPALVKKVERMLHLAEYKRRQAAPGVKLTAKNFGRDRRYPITNKFREEL
ncbi:Glutamine-dependent NAD(+) synthetase [Methyloligella halotolerans]|uniref:Glutamine-dependent NAD(+) synthetase n=1 Tax=Methyloligella halotolerans TaxID=1177755 RepID=A0A1E2RWM1_9HYPH|nr:NAD+ synthase [Methyloligella halotolerans]ODA66552.1 Glutamine-dependent NAD(+) synthetase [Methyloligella halotolerans]